MGLQAFEVHICAKTETRGLEVAFFIKVTWSIVSVVPQEYDYFEEKESVCRQLFFKLLFLATCNLKQILTMIVTIK